MNRRALAVVIGFALLWSGSTVSAVDPRGADVAFLVDRRGGVAADWLMTSESWGPDPLTGEEIRVAKYINVRTDEVAGVVSAPQGGNVQFDDLQARRAQALAALPPLERKADRALLDLVADIESGRSTRASLPVSVFVAADRQRAIDAVFERNPQVGRIANMPTSDLPDVVRSVRDELRAAIADVHIAAEDAVAARLQSMGGKIIYQSSAAPLLFAEVPADLVRQIAEFPEVTDLGLDGGDWHEAMLYAGPTIQADWTSGSGDQGTGVKVAVVEYRSVIDAGDLNNKIVAWYDASTGATSTQQPPCPESGGGHPSWVAGAVASQGVRKGVAPGALILSAATCSSAESTNDHLVIAAADWAIGQGADVLNMSLVQDTSTGLESARKYFDSVVDVDYATVVAATGNLVDCGTPTATAYEWVGSPGVGWNVLTVGGIDDGNTTSHSNDVLWYDPDNPTGPKGACWVDPISNWNPPQDPDFEKPEVSAPAVDVWTANVGSDYLHGDGTSVAAPMVSGIAAQLIARSAIADANPNFVKAMILAGAIWYAPLPPGSAGSHFDHQGVGVVSARWPNNILNNNRYHTGTFNCDGCSYTTSFGVQIDQHVQIAVAWNSQTSGSDNWNKTDNLDADLDLVVTLPDGSKTYSTSAQNSWEYVDFTANQNGMVTVKVDVFRLDTSIQPYALAWIVASTPF